MTGSEKKAATFALLRSLFHQFRAAPGKMAIASSSNTNGTTKPRGIRSPRRCSTGSVPAPEQQSTTDNATAQPIQRLRRASQYRFQVVLLEWLPGGRALSELNHSGSGCPLVSGRNGSASSPSRNTVHIVMPAYRMSSGSPYPA